jgi:hypothetical protein
MGWKKGEFAYFYTISQIDIFFLQFDWSPICDIHLKYMLYSSKTNLKI